MFQRRLQWGEFSGVAPGGDPIDLFLVCASWFLADTHTSEFLLKGQIAPKI